jgi:hypothetical protein
MEVCICYIWEVASNRHITCIQGRRINLYLLFTNPAIFIFFTTKPIPGHGADWSVREIKLTLSSLQSYWDSLSSKLMIQALYHQGLICCKSRDSSPYHHYIWTDSVTYPASYPVGIRGFLS